MRFDRQTQLLQQLPRAAGMRGAIAGRTGITITPDQIAINEFRPGCLCGLISFSKENVRDLLLWAMQDDLVCGKALEFVVPVKKAA